MGSIAIVIPVYQHARLLASTIPRLEGFNLPIIVVNDGSDPEESQLIRLVCEAASVFLHERKVNGGKGAAVMDGLRIAARQGFSHAFQIDADGQHDYTRIPEFVRISTENPEALVLGYPQFDDSVPTARKAGRWLTHVWVWINSLSFRVRDSMCGFRIYPVKPVLEIVEHARLGHHMEFDPEICVRACWKNLHVINLPVHVTYPEQGKSNFRMKEDNVLLSIMHTRLFFGMLIRSPVLLSSRIVGICRSFFTI